MSSFLSPLGWIVCQATRGTQTLNVEVHMRESDGGRKTRKVKWKTCLMHSKCVMNVSQVKER
jgi:hypothetical protein